MGSVKSVDLKVYKQKCKDNGVYKNSGQKRAADFNQNVVERRNKKPNQTKVSQDSSQKIEPRKEIVDLRHMSKCV